MTNGYDISYAQGAVAWSEVVADFVEVKATEALFVDNWWHTNAAGARARGIPLVPYHFAHPDQNSADDEAAHFLDVIDGAPIVGWELDFEKRTGFDPISLMGGAGPAAAWSDRFAEIVASALDLPGDWYSFRDYAKRIAPLLRGRWRGVWLASASDDPTGPYLGTNYGTLPVLIEQYGQRNDEPGFATAVDVDVSSLNFKPPTPPEDDDMPASAAQDFKAILDSVTELYDRFHNTDAEGLADNVADIADGKLTLQQLARELAHPPK